MGKAVRESFDTNVGSMSQPVTAKCSDLSIVVAATGAFDAVVVTEDLAHGQSVLAYTLEQQVSIYLHSFLC